MDYDGVIDELTRWAVDDENVRALVVVGSAAGRAPHPLSDRDIEIFATDPAPLLADESWWDRLGEVLVVERLENPEGFPSRLVYYAGGKLDFTIVPADVAGAGVRDRAFVVLVDKDARISADVSTAPSRLPTAEEFDECLNWAYAAALMIAKAVVRDEPWSAKFRDVDLKQGLLRLIEWDHRSRHGLGHDTRYLGTRMREWMDPDIQDALENCWARFDAVDTATALLATVDLVALVARRLETRHGYVPFRHDRLREEITDILGMTPELSEVPGD